MIFRLTCIQVAERFKRFLARPRSGKASLEGFRSAILLLALLTASLHAAAPALPYKGYIVMDAGTGDVLLSANPDEISPPASMTKLMTYAVLADQLRAGKIALNTPITVTKEDAKVGAVPHSTSVWLRTGETFTVDELIYAMMIQSANDAAYMVGRVVGGNVPNFVAMMNAKAKSLGMNHSTFRTPNGFPVKSHRVADGDLTSPRDFAILCRYLIANTDILHYTSVKSRTFGAGTRVPATQMTNHNHLLGKVEGLDGLKTGFTDGAGFCLSATAKRNGRRIIVVMMDCPAAKSRDLTVLRLIEQGFNTPVIKRAVIAPAAARPVQAPAPSPATNPAPGATPGGPPPIRFVMPGSGG